MIAKLEIPMLTDFNLYFFSVVTYGQKFSVYTFLLLTIFITLHFSYLRHYKLKYCRAKTGRFVKNLTADFGNKKHNTCTTVQNSFLILALCIKKCCNKTIDHQGILRRSTED